MRPRPGLIRLLLLAIVVIAAIAYPLFKSQRSDAPDKALVESAGGRNASAGAAQGTAPGKSSGPPSGKSPASAGSSGNAGNAGDGSVARVTPPSPSLAPSAPAANDASAIAIDRLPREARSTLELIKRGGPFPYGKDGSIFSNREKALPRQPRGYYTEYTVRTPGARDRGARRIIAGGDPKRGNEYYYTDDHYQSFKRIVN